MESIEAFGVGCLGGEEAADTGISVLNEIVGCLHARGGGYGEIVYPRADCVEFDAMRLLN